MSRYLTYFVLTSFLTACGLDDKEVSIGDAIEQEHEESSMDPKGTYPVVLESSIPKLDFISDAWESSDIYCSDRPGEKFHQIRVIERHQEISYVVFSTVEAEEGVTFFFNEFDGMGELMSRKELPGVDYSFNDKINLRLQGNYVFYFKTLDNKQAKYFSLETGEHGDTTDNVIEWDRNYLEYGAPDFPSPSRNKVIQLYDTKLVLRDLTDKSSDTLIDQEYRGSWSFGQGVWNKESTKFHFDNSGSVACIWEIDIERKTLNKIVSEHYAKHPFFFMKDGTRYIVYCENNCIKITTPALQN